MQILRGRGAPAKHMPFRHNPVLARKAAKRHRIARAQRHIMADLDKRADLYAEMNRLVAIATKPKV